LTSWRAACWQGARRLRRRDSGATYREPDILAQPAKALQQRLAKIKKSRKLKARGIFSVLQLFFNYFDIFLNYFTIFLN
jgi:hypothetical protein